MVAVTPANVAPRVALMALRDKLAIRSNSRQGRDIVRITLAGCVHDQGAPAVLAAFQSLYPDAIGVGCDGRCYAGVRVVIEKPFKPTKSRSWFGHHGEEEIEETLHYYDNVTAAQAASILDGAGTESAKDDFFEGASPVVTEQNGWIDPSDLGDALARGAYIRFAEAVQMTPDELAGFVDRAKIVDRGGDYRPIAPVWRNVRAASGSARSLVVRAETSSAGAVKDNHLIEGNPHRLLEGALIAAHGLGAESVLFEVDGVSALARERLSSALASAREAGLLGDSILGMPLRIEAAIRPPAESDQAEGSTWHYVETLFQLPAMFQRGPEGYLDRGVPEAGGTKVFVLDGDVRRRCVAEMPFGSSLRDLVDGPGGGASGEIEEIEIDGAPVDLPGALGSPVAPRGAVPPGAGGVTVHARG